MKEECEGEAHFLNDIAICHHDKMHVRPAHEIMCLFHHYGQAVQDYRVDSTNAPLCHGTVLTDDFTEPLSN